MAGGKPLYIRSQKDFVQTQSQGISSLFSKSVQNVTGHKS